MRETPDTSLRRKSQDSDLRNQEAEEEEREERLRGFLIKRGLEWKGWVRKVK